MFIRSLHLESVYVLIRMHKNRKFYIYVAKMWAKCQYIHFIFCAKCGGIVIDKEN